MSEQPARNKLILEVCVDSIASALNAQQGAAARVELCANLPEGGTTPSAAMIAHVRHRINIGLQVMLRTRGGDFLYAEEEFEVIKSDLKVIKQLGADGVVFGFLTPEGNIDKQRSEEIIRLARPMNVTFHRAFDMAQDPFRALDELIQLGVDRVLTSGQQPSAPEGMELIAQLVRQARGKISILAGGGIRPHNIKQLVEQTGVTECHVSGRKRVESKMQFINNRVQMGGSLPGSEYENLVTDADIIRSFSDV